MCGKPQITRGLRSLARLWGLRQDRLELPAPRHGDQRKSITEDRRRQGGDHEHPRMVHSGHAPSVSLQNVRACVQDVRVHLRTIDQFLRAFRGYRQPNVDKSLLLFVQQIVPGESSFVAEDGPDAAAELWLRERGLVPFQSLDRAIRYDRWQPSVQQPDYSRETAFRAMGCQTGHGYPCAVDGCGRRW